MPLAAIGSSCTGNFCQPTLLYFLYRFPEGSGYQQVTRSIKVNAVGGEYARFLILWIIFQVIPDEDIAEVDQR
jgi:hypothetical protein